MSKGSTFTQDFLNLILCAKAIANVADNAAVAPITAISVALHSADPSSGTGQNQNEITYTAYTRVTTTRSTAGWTVTGSGPATVSPVSAINFPQCTTASTVVASHFSVGLSSAAGAAGKIFWSGTLTPNISLGANVTPQITTGTSITES